MRELVRSSDLAATPAQLWAHAVDPVGINAELRPLLRMTFPAAAAAKDIISTAPTGRTLFRSWILLGGIVPVEYDDLCLVEVEPGRRFLERSRLLSQRVWQHERIIEPVGDGGRITDVVSFEPRVSLLAPLHAAVFGLVFTLRHRNLRRIFGRL